MCNIFLNCIFFFLRKKPQDFIVPTTKGSLCRMKEGILRAGRRPLLVGDERVPQDRDDRVPARERLGDVVVLVSWSELLALDALGALGPQLHLPQHRVPVPVDGPSHGLGASCRCGH